MTRIVVWDEEAAAFDELRRQLTPRTDSSRAGDGARPAADDQHVRGDRLSAAGPALGQCDRLHGAQPAGRGAGAEFRQHDFFGRAAFDGEGPIIWYFQAPDGEQPYVMARGANGNIVYLARFQGGSTAAGPVEIDPFGRELHRLTDRCVPFGPMHHEVQVLPGWRVLYVSRDVLCEAPVPQEGDTLGIWEAEAGTGAIIRNIFDHLSPADSVEPASNQTLPGHPVWGGSERDRRVQDWWHGNSRR